MPKMYRIRLHILLLTLALFVASAAPHAQTFNAQIQAFWNQLRTGALKFSTMGVASGGYVNFGATVGTNGYGFRDNSGTMQFKDSGGSWNDFPAGGSAPSTSKYLIQVADAALPNAQSMGALGSGLVFNTTTTGVQSVVANVATGSYLRSAGTGTTPPIWSTLILPNAATTGDLLLATSTNTIGSLTDVGTGQVLMSGGIGVAPAYTATPSGLTSVGAATLNYTTALTKSGTAVSGVLVCSNTAASGTITGTGKQYLSLNCKVPANYLAAGTTIKLDARGIYSGNATDTLVMTVEACQVSGCASGTKVTLATTSALTLLAVSNQYFQVDENINAFTIGGSGTLDTQGFAMFETASTTAVIDATPNTGTATVSTIADEYLSISVTFSTASASDSITLRNLQVTVQ